MLGKLFGKKTRAPYQKKFDGERYRLVGIYNYKSDANNQADAIRNRGKKARIVAIKGGYAVYKRG